MARNWIWLGLITAFCALGGCSRMPPTGIVEGQVTLDGQPLPSGLIRFVPATGDVQPADAPIAAGKFSAVVATGDFRVEITAPKVVGKMKLYDTPDSPTVEKIEEALPGKYNVATELKFTVAKGKNETTFALKSK